MASAVTSSSMLLRDVGREDLDLQLAQHVVEHAAEVAHAVGDADEVNGTSTVTFSSARTS